MRARTLSVLVASIFSHFLGRGSCNVVESQARSVGHISQPNGGPILLTPQVAPHARTFIFTLPNWWESADHQLTTAITQFALAKNISATAVLPNLVGQHSDPGKSFELFGHFYDADVLRQVQPFMGMTEFKNSNNYELLRDLAKDNILKFPKAAQESYEKELGVLSSIAATKVSFNMPHVDLENTDMFCSEIPGTVHLSKDKSVRFIFLDRVHFYHFCTEKYMPWWYDVRMHIVPRPEYMQLASHFMKRNPAPLTVVHIRDLMDHQRERDEEDIERYARQISDAMRRNRKTTGTLYLAYALDGRSVARVAQLFEAEFPVVKKCMDLFVCGRLVEDNVLVSPPSEELSQILFGTEVGSSLVEVALSIQSDHFVGNIYSPYSRNVALYRKLHGKSYDVLKGFGEMRKIWRWRL